MCCSSPPASSSTPLLLSLYYPSIGLVVNIIHTQIFCDHINVLYIFDQAHIILKSGWNYTARMPRLVVSLLVLPDEHPPTPPPSRWPALIGLPTLAKFISFGVASVMLCCPLLLFEHTLTAVCAIPEYQSGRKYNIHSYICDHLNILIISTRLISF